MISINGTRIYAGYSKYGTPPVVWFALEIPETGPACRDAASLHGELVRLGLGDLWAADEGAGSASGLAEVFASLTSGLLREAGHEAGVSAVERTGSDGTHTVAISCEEPSSGLYAGEFAKDVLTAVCAGPVSDELTTDLEDYLAFARNRLPDGDARLVIRAARRRNLPVVRLDQAPFAEAPEERFIRCGLFQIGYGSRRRVLLGAMPAGLDQELLERLNNRALLSQQLAASGIPLPRQDRERPNQNMVSRATRTAERLGYPVVVKSLLKQEFPHRHRAVRIYGPLDGPEQVALAFEAAAEPIRKVWVEGYASGESYRFVVIGGRLRAVTRCRPPTVVGDGQATIEQLIRRHAEAATAPAERASWSELLAGDADVELRLRLAGLARDSVLPEGRQVELRGVGTPCNGGVCEDATELVSGEVKRLAERAALCCSLDGLAGVDMVIVDPLGAPTAPNCVVTDVLPDPDLLRHARPTTGVGRDLADDLVGFLFPDGRPARVPLVAVTGTNGKTTTARMVAHIQRHQYRHVGVATTEGAFVDDEPVLDGDVAGVSGGAMVLADDRTEAAVLETARGGLVKDGAVFEWCDVGACLNVASDHLGADGIDTPEQLAEVKAEVIRRSSRAVLVNGEDPLCRRMLEQTNAPRRVLVAAGGPSDVVEEHLQRGGPAVLAETHEGAPWIVFVEAGKRVPLMPLSDVPATLNGLLRLNTFNALFAAGIARETGVGMDVIRQALGSFSNSFEHNPGRYNFIEGFSFTLLLDFAHNPDGVQELCQVVMAMAPRGKRTRLMCLTVGARHKSHIDLLAPVLARTFDTFALGCNQGYAGKNPEYAGEDPPRMMLEHFEACLMAEGVPARAITSSREPEEVIASGLDSGEEGDLLVLLAYPDMVRPVLERQSRPRAG